MTQKTEIYRESAIVETKVEMVLALAFIASMFFHSNNTWLPGKDQFGC